MAGMKTDQKKLSVWPIVGGVLALLPALYVASIGPVYALPENWVPAETLLTFYDPLWMTAEALGLGPLLESYVELWLGLFYVD